MKLYKVTLKGMTYSSTGLAYGVSYVVANDSNDAYLKVRKFLDEQKLGYERERELDKVELLADEYRYNNTGHLLYL